jgi:hypothetical protein
VVGITEAALTYFRSGRQELDAPVLTMTMEQARSVASVALFYGKDRTTLERIITDQGWLVEDYDEDDEEEDDEDEDVS